MLSRLICMAPEFFGKEMKYTRTEKGKKGRELFIRYQKLFSKRQAAPLHQCIATRRQIVPFNVGIRISQGRGPFFVALSHAYHWSHT